VFDGMYDKDGVCDDCNYKCEKCTISATNCDPCADIRENKPTCNCPNGYWDEAGTPEC
jgi:hypothetical protein